MPMGNEVFYVQGLQSLNSEKPQQIFRIHRHILRHRHNVRSKHSNRGTIDSIPTYPQTLQTSKNRKNSIKEIETLESKYSIHNSNTKETHSSTHYKRHSIRQTKHSLHKRQEITDTEFNRMLRREHGESEDHILHNVFSVCQSYFLQTNRKPLFQKKPVLHEYLIQIPSIRNMILLPGIIKCI